MVRILLMITVFSSLVLEASPKTRALYNSLDPYSVSQHLALYELYPESFDGKQALRHGWKLLMGTSDFSNHHLSSVPFKHSGIHTLVGLVNKQPNEETNVLTDKELSMIERIANRLPNRWLKGFRAKNEKEVLNLDSSEVDLARGLLLTQVDKNRMRTYEAMIDLMALQILARIPVDASPERKIQEMNRFIFEEMGFRFPPHSLYAKDIDIYTFLPSVLDSRHGVCLGVSILYICLAQRLDLPLEVVTPPGHIYIRYRQGDKIINIETTARGIHLDSEVYKGINTRKLQERNVKDVIGLAHINQAAGYLQSEQYEKALDAYEKAKPYLPNDMLLKELMGYTYLFVGKLEEGKQLLKEVQYHVPEYAVIQETIAEDYLNGHVDVDGIKPLFMHVDENRESILKKKNQIEKVLKKYPRFRAGVFGLAITWLQLHRTKEGLEVLQRYHELDCNDPTAEYYLTILYASRYDFNKSWDHLKITENIVKAKQHHPKALKMVRKQLNSQYPE